MRIACAIAASILAVAPAVAADYLRGGYAPPSVPRSVGEQDQLQWEGFYAGAFAGYSSGRFRPYSATSPNSLMGDFYTGSAIPAPFQLVSAFDPTLNSARRAGFGGFVGYNMVFGDAMVGVEADLSWLNMRYTGSRTVLATDIIGPGVGYAALTGSSTSKLDGYATFRARAGWAYGSIMPYITGGLAVGKGSYSSALTLNYSATAPLPPAVDGSQTSTTSKSLAFVVGGTIGAGVDALIANNILLRAEYQFTTFSGNGIPLDLHTVRVGAGVKF